MCGLTALLSIGSAVAGFAAEQAKADAENEARAANRASARADYNRQIEEEQRGYAAEVKATNQAAFDEQMKTRAAAGRQRAEAATQGAAGLSVDAVFNEIIAIGGRNQSRLKDEQQVNELNYQNRVDTAKSNADSRINTNQPVSGPSPLGLAINIGTSIAKAF